MYLLGVWLPSDRVIATVINLQLYSVRLRLAADIVLLVRGGADMRRLGLGVPCV